MGSTSVQIKCACRSRCQAQAMIARPSASHRSIWPQATQRITPSSLPPVRRGPVVQALHASVATTELAAHLEVAPASVTGMVRKLHRQGLVKHVPYQGVTLTSEGRQEALPDL